MAPFKLVSSLCSTSLLYITLTAQCLDVCTVLLCQHSVSFHSLLLLKHLFLKPGWLNSRLLFSLTLLHIHTSAQIHTGSCTPLLLLVSEQLQSDSWGVMCLCFRACQCFLQVLPFQISLVGLVVNPQHFVVADLNLWCEIWSKSSLFYI